jgi:hypothetical protein
MLGDLERMPLPLLFIFFAIEGRHAMVFLG